MGRNLNARAAAALLALAALCAACAVPPTADAAKRPIKVKPSNPFYPVLEAFGEGQVAYGALVGDCVMRPYTTCHGGDISGARANGALAPFSALKRLNAAR